MPTEDDVAFLESFREKITAFLAAGAAPTQDLLWGGRALIKMKEAMQDPVFRELRQDLNRMKGRAAQILEGLGIGCTFSQYPPPAVGGPVVKVPLFDLITENRSLHTLDGTVFTDKIDEAIGLLQHSGDTELVGAAAPVFLVKDIRRAIEFYEGKLGFRCRHRAGSRSPQIAILERGSANILLKVEDRARAREAYFHTPDTAALAADFAECGLTVRNVTADNLDGWRGFEIIDPDGNRLFFGSLN